MEQRLERKQNERDVLEVLGDHKCDTGVSVENVPAVFNIKAVKGGFIAHKFSTGWTVGVVKSFEKKKSVAGQFAVEYKSETSKHVDTGLHTLCSHSPIHTHIF